MARAWKPLNVDIDGEVARTETHMIATRSNQSASGCGPNDKFSTLATLDFSLQVKVGLQEVFDASDDKSHDLYVNSRHE